MLSRCTTTALLLCVVFGSALARVPFETKPLVGGYVIDIPVVFEIRDYRQERDRDTSGKGWVDANRESELILVAGRWRGPFQFAFIGVRTHPEWNVLHDRLDQLSRNDWQQIRDQMFSSLAPELASSGSSVIETMEPVVTDNAAGDKLVLIKYRKQDRHTTTTAGQWMVIRPSDSFAVAFSFDEEAGSAEFVEMALQSIRRP